MKATGELTGLCLDYMTKKASVTFAVDADPAQIEGYKGKPIDIEFKVHRMKRSLNANAYFHVLCGKIATRVGRSMSYTKNLLISTYGQVMIVDDQQVVIKANIPPEAMQEEEFIHTKMVKVGKESNTFFYRIYRGSSTYNTDEMSRLIDGTVLEAKELGIETMTPDQLRRMMAAWENSYEKKHNH